jgi:hypothetical protein
MTFRIFRILLLFVLAGLISGAVRSWADEPILTPERILSFKSEIEIQTDASLLVTETITVTATGEKIIHGLLREFPISYRSIEGRNIQVGFEIKKALCNGQPEPFRLERTAKSILIFVGRTGVMLTPGVYTYALTYRTDRQLGFFSQYDALYWNVTGTNWPFRIEKASVRVVLPPGAKVLQTEGYTGAFGSQEADYLKGMDEQLQPIFTTTRVLTPGEGFTIAVAWPKGYVQVPSAREKFLQSLQDQIPNTALTAAATLLILFIYFFTISKLVGPRPSPGTIIPSFYPPQNLSAGELRFLWNRGYDAKIMTATVVQLAVQGVLTIEEKKGKYFLHKTEPPSSVISPEAQALAAKFFPTAPSLELHSRNHAQLESAVSLLKHQLKSKFKNLYFKSYRQFVAIGAGISLVGFTAMVLLANDAVNALGMAALWVFWSCIMLLMLALTLQQFKDFFTTFKPTPFFMGLFSSALLAFTFWFAVNFYPRINEALSPAAAAVWFFIPILHVFFYRRLKFPTALEQKYLDQIAGFKLYLSTTRLCHNCLNERNEHHIISPLPGVSCGRGRG